MSEEKRTFDAVLQEMNTALVKVASLERDFRLAREEAMRARRRADDCEARCGEALHAKREAEEANDRKSRFLANMAHEFRTPLHAIIGFSEMLERDPVGREHPNMMKYARSIGDSGRHVLKMLNDILDFGKMEAGRLSIALEPVELEPLLNEVKAYFHDVAMERGIDILTQIEPELTHVFADPTRLRQIILNLLDNAVKYNRDGGLVCVNVSNDAPHQVSFQVSDTGIGIPADNQNEIFTEFHQVNRSRKRSRDGAGLGLALTKRLVEMHGGTISVESQEDIGSMFTFTMPAASPDGRANGGSA